MKLKSMFRFCTSILVTLSISLASYADTIGVFFDPTTPQIKFAANDVKQALELKGFTVELLALNTLNSGYANKKVVLALASDTAVKNMLTNQGGTLPDSLGEQAYGLRTSNTPQSYWVLGGDNNGAMYGGFQLAENIKFYGFTGTYNTVESPQILKRGIKLNLPFDKNSTTYFNANNSTGARYAITNVWDTTFWISWFDEMARNRYNVISIWNNHPFTSMIKMADYPDVAIQNVTGYPDFKNNNDKTGAVIKIMSIDEKIIFWKKIMAHAKSRGFSFYLFNWNLFLYGAEGKYDLVRDIKNQKTIDYMRKCMYELLKTYPDLDGFGITQGEAMGDYTDQEKSLFLSETYGMGMADFAKENPTRKLNFIHRWWFADFDAIKTNFSELLKLPNVTFDMSYKYSFAHMYSSTDPDFFDQDDINALVGAGLKTWFTVRNDDFFYHNWGDPTYAREYINNIPGQGSWFKGFYMGSDGNNPTRTFFSKDSVHMGILEVQRQWYMYKLWGRLSYNPNTPDAVFKEFMKFKYPSISSDDLFTAWSKVSNAITKVGEMFFDDFKNDQSWYPENCQSDDGFLTIAHIAAASPRDPSSQCGIPGTAANACGSKISSFTIANLLENESNAALSLVSAMVSASNTEQEITVNTVKAMAYLNIYYAYKIRGATYNLMSGRKTDALKSLATAYCWWIKYSTLMDEMYEGMAMQRNAAFANWHQHDAAVLTEFTNLGGVGIPTCSASEYQVSLSVNDNARGTATGEGKFSFGAGVTVTATSKPGYKFTGWYDNNSLASKDSIFSFIITNNVQLVGKFEIITSCIIPWIDASGGVTINNAAVSKTFDSIFIDCVEKVRISMTVEGQNTDASDYCNLYYAIDNGSLKTIEKLTGAFSEKLVSVSGVKGNKLKIYIVGSTNLSDEFYKVKNIKVEEDLPLGISGNSTIDDIDLYPNPVSDVLHIDFPINTNNREVRIINAMGKVIFVSKIKESEIEIDIKSLNLEGIVLIQLIDGDKVSNHKVLVK